MRGSPTLPGALAAAALLAAPLAAQQVCTANLSTPLAATNWATTLPVPRFDPTFGTLVEVQLNLASFVDSQVVVENVAATPGSGSVDVSALLVLSRPDLTLLLATQPATSTPLALAGFDGTLDFGGPSGASLYLFATTGGVTWTLTSPADLALMSGPPGASGTVDLPVSAQDLSAVIGFSGVAAGFATSASASLRVCYRYQVPATFCAGDGSGAACPCGNASPAGLDVGCLNSTGSGGRLTAAGTASLALDLVVLTADALPPGAPALFFQGTAREAGGAGSAFGDGLRCAGGTVVRLATKAAVAGTCRYPEPGDASVSLRGGVAAPGLRTYQVWYRNAAPYCTSATFNLTGGIEVGWTL